MNLAYRLRPSNLDEFFGQEHLVGPSTGSGQAGLVRKMIESDNLFSMILWGPPGSGKTTLAHIISKETKSSFHALSGVSAGKSELQEILRFASDDQKRGVRTILFIDEIHRWNKAQQDSLLPHVENGSIILIGATTENPSFEVISPLLSRCRVFLLKSLDYKDLNKIINRALSFLEKYKKTINDSSRELLIRLSGGDGRILLNAIEIAVNQYKGKKIDEVMVQDIFQTKSAGLYDKKADEHYNIISAFIKSMRGSDADAALYYLARMLENGEDPKFIARRMIIFASEDIGLADRGALIQANAGFEAVHKIGMPEAQLILAHICLYLSTAKKSRAVVNALSKAKEAVYEFPNEPIPLHLRNAPTKLMKSLGYGKNYTWSEKYVGSINKSSFLPEKLKEKKFYNPNP